MSSPRRARGRRRWWRMRREAVRYGSLWDVPTSSNIQWSGGAPSIGMEKGLVRGVPGTDVFLLVCFHLSGNVSTFGWRREAVLLLEYHNSHCSHLSRSKEWMQNCFKTNYLHIMNYTNSQRSGTSGTTWTRSRSGPAQRLASPKKTRPFRRWGQPGDNKTYSRHHHKPMVKHGSTGLGSTVESYYCLGARKHRLSVNKFARIGRKFLMLIEAGSSINWLHWIQHYPHFPPTMKVWWLSSNTEWTHVAVHRTSVWHHVQSAFQHCPNDMPTRLVLLLEQSDKEIHLGTASGSSRSSEGGCFFRCLTVCLSSKQSFTYWNLHIYIIFMNFYVQ